jgi:phage protein D
MALVALGDTSVPEKRTENETPLKPRADETGRVISSPAPTKAHAKHVAKGKVQTAAMKSIEAEAVTIGLPYLKARETVQIENIGKKFSGRWRISKVRHEISNGGYKCTMTLNKNDHEGKSSSKRSAPKASTGKSSQAKLAVAVKPGTSKPAKVVVDLN